MAANGSEAVGSDRMRYQLVSISALLLMSGSAQGSDLTHALAALKKSGVAWNIAKAQRADVTCDGKPDIVMFGTGKNAIWVGMAPGDGSKPQVMEFSISNSRQDGFGSPPVRIDVYPINCESEAGHLDGCRPVRNCKSFSVDDEETDPFNFYWDDRHKVIRWWRN